MAVQADPTLRFHRNTSRPAASAASTSVIGAYLAEFTGTFILVFAITATATSAGLAQTVAGSSFGSLAIVLVNGLALAALVGGLGHVSSAHFNPAVTIAMAVIRKFSWRHVPGYVAVQMAGGILAALATWAIHGNAARNVMHLAATNPKPGVSDGRALLVEFLITFILVFVVTAVATDKRFSAPAAPLVVGFALATAVFIGGPTDGAAVNPARGLGPMIASGSYGGWWVSIVGPIAGGIVAAVLYNTFVRKGEPPAVKQEPSADHALVDHAAR
ncbi:MAG: glycerol uptake facilitator protein [Streptomyces sp.]|nr:glycerol uptake facilitator protein [Streptomyces sp.]MDX6351168.1 glycerol uptake facilitator protein [Streptomyces sp.]